MAEALGLRSGRRVDWLRLLGWCALAGTAHTVVKVLFSWLRTRKMLRMLEDTPWARTGNEGSFRGFTVGFQKNRKRAHDWIHEISVGLPVSKMCGLMFEPKQVALIVRDPACIKHFLKDNFDSYTKPGPNSHIQFAFLRMWLGDGIFLFRHGVGAEDGGHAWLTQRKISSNIFSRDNFRNNMREVFVEKAHRMCDLLSDSADRGETVDLQKMFFGFTMDSITRIFFGEDADTMAGAACEYGEAFDEAHRSMLAYTRPNMSQIYMMSYLPWPLGWGIFSGLASTLHSSLNKEYRRFRRACRLLDVESKKIVDKCRADPNIDERKDLLALFIQAEERERFTTKYLRDMVLNFVIAGRDTTACLLSWMFYELSTKPDIQARLIAEIEAKLPAGGEPTLSALGEGAMPFLNGVIYETLRLHPPVPIDLKMTASDDVFPDGTRVPKGTMIWFVPYAMARDPAMYPEPEVFRPERWIPFKAPSPYEFPVFQAGPRICLGVNMAVFEAKVLAVMLLQRYTFKLKAGEEDKIHYSGTITMSVCNSKDQDSHNLWITPSKRSA